MTSTDRLALLKARQRRMAAAKGGNHAAVAAGRAPGALSAARSHEANEAYETSVGDALGALSLTGSAAGAGAGDLARSQAPPAPLAGEGAPCEPPGVARGRGALSKAAWLRGPRDAAGKRVDLSDRPLLAASAHGDSAVVAGSDHALYELTLGRAPKRARKLYTKTHGHTEWVTCVAHAADGRVLSGGMDSALCLWEKGRVVRAQRLEGHTGSISAVACGAARAVSAGYDKALRVWDLGASGLRAKEVCALKGHKAPVLCLDWAGEGGQVATGARDGALAIWELGAARGAASAILSGAHSGHVTALQWQCAAGGGDSGGLLLSGGQDGRVRGWDARAKGGAAEVAAMDAHVSAAGAGAVGAIRRLDWSGEKFATMGADGAVRVWDARTWGAVHTWREHGDFVYCLEAVDGIVLSGDGAGRVLVHDSRTGECTYGLGAGRNAIRALCIGARGDSLLAAGDDGDAMVYHFES